jgi:co-chaperonin GroES (HSP10)
MVKEVELEEATGPGTMLSETAKEKLQTAQVVAVRRPRRRQGKRWGWDRAEPVHAAASHSPLI